LPSGYRTSDFLLSGIVHVRQDCLP
jgi:hypothetical protein